MKTQGKNVIETERLILRPFTLEDASYMYERWASDPEVTKYLTWQPHESVEVTRAYISAIIEKYETSGVYDWAIERKGVGVIGSIGVVGYREETKAAEIGYCLGKAYWGQGIMPEALIAILDFLFEEAGCLRVSAKHDIANPKSGRVMEKAGMKYEGTLRQAGYNNRGIIDEVHYAMILEDRR